MNLYNTIFILMGKFPDFVLIYDLYKDTEIEG